MHRTQADSFETQNRSNNWARLRKGKKTPKYQLSSSWKLPLLLLLLLSQKFDLQLLRFQISSTDLVQEAWSQRGWKRSVAENQTLVCACLLASRLFRHHYLFPGFPVKSTKKIEFNLTIPVDFKFTDTQQAFSVPVPVLGGYFIFMKNLRFRF